MKDDSHKALIPLKWERCVVLCPWRTTVNPSRCNYTAFLHLTALGCLQIHRGGSTDDPQRQTQQLCQEENIIIILAQDVKMLFLGL